MTVTYSGQVANAKLSAFSRLLFYWRGSIYKLMYKEMFIFMCLYALCSLIYRFALNSYQRGIFEKIALHCEMFTNLIPLSFVLGFYVAIVVTRWWNQFLAIPWPDRLALYVGTLIEGYDDHCRLVRRSIMRYVLQSTLIVLQGTSVSVKKRFPTLEHLVETGLMTPNEQKVLEEVNTPHGKWWVPFNWVFNLIKECRVQGLITDDFLMKTVMEEAMTYRGNLGMLYNYDWISIPLVYTQVTTLAVYTFFIGCILGRQFLDPTKGYPGHDVDLYFPVFTVLQFFFYMGWMKVAEQMINPFGEDDDDFDMNWMIDRNTQISFMYVDDMFGTYPKLERDIYWDEQPPPFLPYTKSAIPSITKPFMGSTAEISITEDQMKVINPMETIREECPQEIKSSSTNIHSGFESKLTSTMVSPLGSPSHSQHHLANNLMATNHLRSPLSLSKSTLDGSKNNSEKISENKLMQTLAGASTVPKPPAYIDGWLNQEPGSRFDISAVPAKLPSPLTNHRRLSNALTQSIFGTSSLVSLEKPENSNAPSNTTSIAQSLCATTMYPGSYMSHPATLKLEDEKNLADNSCNKSENKDTEEGGETNNLQVSPSSSNQSLPEYDPPDPNQCTVSSLTPLLDAISNKPESNKV